MPASITIYTFENSEGEESGCLTTQDYDEAKRYAQTNSLLVVSNEYVWDEAIPLDDYRPKDRWVVQTTDGYVWFEEDDFDSEEEAQACAIEIRTEMRKGESGVTDVRVVAPATEESGNND